MKTTLSIPGQETSERHSFITFIGISKSTINYVEFDDSPKDELKHPVDMIICTIATSHVKQKRGPRVIRDILKDYFKKYEKEIESNEIMLRVFESDETVITNEKIMITDNAINATTTILLNK